MGYDIRFSGSIVIDPPIPADEVLAAGFGEEGCYGAKDVAVTVVEAPVEGVPDAYRRLVTQIIPSMGIYTAYQIEDHIQEIVDRWGEGRTFTGRIDCLDPIEGDRRRLSIRNGRLVKAVPQIVWPDEEEA